MHDGPKVSEEENGRDGAVLWCVQGGPRWRRMEYGRARDWNSHMPEIQERALVGWVLVGHMTEVAM